MSDTEQKPAKQKSKGLFGRLFGGDSKEPDSIGPESEGSESEGPESIGSKPDGSEKSATSKEQTPGRENDPADQSPTSDQPPVQDEAPGQLQDSRSPQPPEPKKQSWFQKLTSGLSKTSTQLSDGITGIFTKKKLADEQLEDLEDILIQADLGLETTMAITDALSKGRYEKGITPDDVAKVLSVEVERVLAPVAQPLLIDETRKPHVILVAGVNGSGKTTTIGKLAAKFKADGKKVTLAAGDTFRAAAVEQLKIWAQRTDSKIISHKTGADASGLAFDALKLAQQEQCDVLLVDTAGRLQNKEGLMEELEKVVRVLKKVDPGAPHSVLLVLDATTGQNAMQQVEVFSKRIGVTGLIMTKLDGTARGGILVSISAKHAIPVHAIGVGEGVDDLQPFNAGEFASAIAQSG